MPDFIPITMVIAEKLCARIEHALSILESVDESKVEHDLTEVALALYDAQQTIHRLARQEIWSNSPWSECD